MKETMHTGGIEETSIDFAQVALLFRKNFKFIILTTMLGIGIAFVVTVWFIEKKYESTTRIYLTPKVSDQGVVDNTTINSNSMLVNNYISILKGENILSKVAEKLDIASVMTVKNSLRVENETNTQIIAVYAKTNDPAKSKQIAETTVSIFFSEMKDKLDIRNMTILDRAKLNTAPVSPKIPLNLALGALLGLVVSLGYIALKFVLDKRLLTRAEAESFLGIPVLAEIPFFEE